MAKTGSYGTTDTKTTKLNVEVPQLDYATDYSVTTEVAGEVILTNTTTPLDQIETIRYALSNVSNVYAGTDIDPAFFSTSKVGRSLLVQLENVYRVTCTDDAGSCTPYQVDLPVRVHTVVRVPISSYLDADTILEDIKRQFACLFNGAINSDMINKMLRGSLNPTD